MFLLTKIYLKSKLILHVIGRLGGFVVLSSLQVYYLYILFIYVFMCNLETFWRQNPPTYVHSVGDSLILIHDNINKQK